MGLWAGAGVFDCHGCADDVIVVELSDAEMCLRAVVAVRATASCSDPSAVTGGLPTLRSRRRRSGRRPGRRAPPGWPGGSRTPHRTRGDRPERLLSGARRRSRPPPMRRCLDALAAVAVRGGDPGRLERVGSALTLHQRRGAALGARSATTPCTGVLATASSARRILTDSWSGWRAGGRRRGDRRHGAGPRPLPAATCRRRGRGPVPAGGRPWSPTCATCSLTCCGLGARVPHHARRCEPAGRAGTARRRAPDRA
ncbi:hypothetical protein HBB16_00400 [Pseudonocardia sp. MCCB 268]|nr:hypothetical protein [Pseudonocardia cytotoxica]